MRIRTCQASNCCVSKEVTTNYCPNKMKGVNEEKASLLLHLYEQITKKIINKKR